MLQGINLAIRFVLELVGLVGIGYWGYHSAGSSVGKLVLGYGLPLVVAVVWWAFVAPKARIPLSLAPRLGIEFVVWSAATLAFAAGVSPAVGVAFAVVVTINRALMFVWS